MSGNWWDNNRFPEYSPYDVSIAWARSSLFEKCLKEGIGPFYNANVGGYPLTPIEDIFNEVCSFGGKHAFRDIDIEGLKDTFVFPDGFLRMDLAKDEYSSIDVVTLDKSLADKVTGLSEKYFGAMQSEGKAFVLVQTQSGYTLKSIGVSASPLEDTNYNENVNVDLAHVMQDLNTNNPCGRLVILNGPPGTGKSYALRGLLDAIPKALFIVVPSHLVAHLGDPSIVGALIDINEAKGDAPTVFLIEDADTCLTTRGADNIHAVSSLLNLGDGILGAGLDIRIITTTNAEYNDFDAAIMRPGRLCRFIHFGALEHKVSYKTYKRLTGKEFPDELKRKEEYTLAEIYRLARNEGWQAPKPKRIGFSNHSKPFSEPDLC